MKVLVTGGTGYVGSRLREHIRNQGHEVRLLVRQNSEHKIESSNRYQIVTGDIFNTNACLRACDGCDAVVHLVAIIREFPSRGIIFDEYHRVATQNIIDAARRSGVRRFVHMSALGVREDAPSRYHRTKHVAEQIVRASPMRWTIFRPSWIFGPGDQLTAEVVDLVRKPIVPLIDGGKSLFQPVALEDVCSCMARSLAMPQTQAKTYELGGPDRLAFKDIIRQMATHLGVDAKTVTVPARVIRPLVGVLQRFPWFPLTQDQMLMLSEDNVCEIDHYVKTFQIEPKSFVQAIPALLGGTSSFKGVPALQ